MNRLTARLLIAVYQFGTDSRQVTHLAVTLGVSKSTISRAVQDLQQEGVLLYTSRDIKLTAYGKRQAETLLKEYQTFYQMLTDLGVPPQQATQDSYTMLLDLSAQAKEALNTRVAKPISVYDSLPDGTYSLPFAFYRAGEKGARVLSMANDAFVHPAALSLYSGKGFIRLKMKPVSHVSPFHDQLIHHAMLKKMSYQDGAQNRDCLIEGDTVSILLEALSISVVPDIELPIGEVSVRLTPNVDAKHMPERFAIFTIFSQFHI